jgi:hypothetical protein
MRRRLFIAGLVAALLAFALLGLVLDAARGLRERTRGGADRRPSLRLSE